MLVLGIAGGLNTPQRHTLELPFLLHDAAAVLLQDGEVVAAIEEERLNRIKHTNCFPEQAIRFCLQQAGATLPDVAAIAYYFTEAYANYIIRHQGVAEQRAIPFRGIRAELAEQLQRIAGLPVADRLRFVEHHRAHAASTYFLSGFDESLILVADGMGEHIAISIYEAAQGEMILRRTFDQSHSLGILYLTVCNYLGYRIFEEYKVMALASFGNPATYRDLFARCYRLLPGGEFELNLGLLEIAMGGLFEAHRDPATRTALQQDVAAALQDTLESIMIHVLRGEQAVSPRQNLCLAGGVALNCCMNGRILREGLFERVFVQPASHDAGGALGAALAVHCSLAVSARPGRLNHVYWGSPIPADPAILAEVRNWGDLFTVAQSPQVAEVAAEMLEQGAVIGWVQGRSEFGPRALGNRSILADPRRPESKARINAIIKEREGYRPFAPMVLEEALSTYFHVPHSECSFPYMLFVLAVRAAYRSQLPAITHVDGTARVQTMTAERNPRAAALLEAFRARTGMPILLNTSFNNNAEPIVDSVHDALVTFITSDLDALVIGSLLIRKQRSVLELLPDLIPTLPLYTRLHESIAGTGLGGSPPVNQIATTFRPDHAVEISEALYWILGSADGSRTFGDLLAEFDTERAQREPLAQQAFALWQRRMIGFAPPGGAG